MLEPFVKMRHTTPNTTFNVPETAPPESVHTPSQPDEPAGPGSVLPQEYTTDGEGFVHVHLLHHDHMASTHGLTVHTNEAGGQDVEIRRLPDKEKTVAERNAEIEAQEQERRDQAEQEAARTTAFQDNLERLRLGYEADPEKG